MIVIIPAILGGGLQIIQLVMISPKYIRFFSVSQVIPDGLMILFILGLTVMWLEYVFPTPKVKSRITVFLVAIYLSLVLAILFDKVVGTSNFFWVTLVLYPVSSILILYLIRRSESLKLSEHKLRIFKILAQGGFFISLIFIFTQLQNGRLNLSLPSNFTNLAKLTSKGNLVYFNDQYIFLEVTQLDSTKKIEVLKFDAFFEKDNSLSQNQAAVALQLENDSLKHIIHVLSQSESLKSKVSHLKSNVSN